jgi:hypothetical protein
MFAGWTAGLLVLQRAEALGEADSSEACFNTLGDEAQKGPVIGLFGPRLNTRAAQVVKRRHATTDHRHPPRPAQCARPNVRLNKGLGTISAVCRMIGQPTECPAAGTA